MGFYETVLFLWSGSQLVDIVGEKQRLYTVGEKQRLYRDLGVGARKIGKRF